MKHLVIVCVAVAAVVAAVVTTAVAAGGPGRGQAAHTVAVDRSRETGTGSGAGGAVPPANPGGPMQPAPPIIPVGPVSPPPHGGPDARGVVSALRIVAEGAPDGPAGSLMISGGQAGPGYDKAMVSFGPATRVFAKTSAGCRQVDSGSLTNGQTVAVWFTGAVATSYPVQAWARLIVILP